MAKTIVSRQWDRCRFGYCVKHDDEKGVYAVDWGGPNMRGVHSFGKREFSTYQETIDYLKGLEEFKMAQIEIRVYREHKEAAKRQRRAASRKRTLWHWYTNNPHHTQPPENVTE